MKQQKKGFSMIEMLVVISLFAGLSVIVLQSTASSIKNTRKVDAASRVRDNLTSATDVMIRNLRNASSITSVCNGSTQNSIFFVDDSGVSRGYQCVSGSGSHILDTTSNERLTSDDVLISSCQFTCTKLSDVPESISISISGRLNVSESTEQSEETVSKRVSLRVY